MATNGHDLPHAQLVRDWATGKPLPPAVQEIMDWLLETFPLGPPLDDAEAETFAARAYVSRWHPGDVEPAMLLWQLVAQRDETDKPGE